MRTLVQLYWLRVGLGIFAAALSAILATFLETTAIDPTSILLYSISMALLVYLLSFRILKIKFQNKVEKPSKITLMGIGMYFFAWIAFFVLFYTLIIFVLSV
jgi:hypothetical protein